MRGAGLLRPGGDQGAELLAQLHQLSVIDHSGRDRRARAPALLPARLLLRLLLLEHLPHLIGVEQARDAQELLLVLRADHPAGAVLAAVEQHAVERGFRFERLEGHLQLVGGLLGAVGLLDQALVQPGLLIAALGPAIQDVVALRLHLGGVPHQDRDRGQEDARGLAAGPRAHEAAHGLGEEHGGGGRGGVDAHGQAGNVHTLRHHAHRHHPAVVGVGELLDPLACSDFVGEDHGGRLSRDVLEGRGVGAGGLLVGGDHQTAGIGHVTPHLGEPPIRRGEHRLDPLPLGVQRGAPGLLGDVLGLERAELGGDLVTRLGAPVHAP